MPSAGGQIHEPSPDSGGMIRVRSRWWYWAVAVPAITVLWVASAVWLLVVLAVVSSANATSTSAIVSIPAVGLGLPALAAYFVLPFALLVDARAVSDAGAEWPTDPVRAAKRALAADAVIVAGVLVFFEFHAIIVAVVRGVFGLYGLVIDGLEFFGLHGVLTHIKIQEGVSTRAGLLEFLSMTPERLLGMAVILLGVLAGNALCVWYLRERREHVAMPESLRELRDELR